MSHLSPQLAEVMAVRETVPSSATVHVPVPSGGAGLWMTPVGNVKALHVFSAAWHAEGSKSEARKDHGRKRAGAPGSRDRGAAGGLRSDGRTSADGGVPGCRGFEIVVPYWHACVTFC